MALGPFFAMVLTTHNTLNSLVTFFIALQVKKYPFFVSAELFLVRCLLTCGSNNQ
jgi:hypothetical protein